MQSYQQWTVSVVRPKDQIQGKRANLFLFHPLAPPELTNYYASSCLFVPCLQSPGGNSIKSLCLALFHNFMTKAGTEQCSITCLELGVDKGFKDSCLDQTTTYFSQSSPCQIKQSQWRKFLTCLSWETDNTTSVTPTDHCSLPWIHRPLGRQHRAGEENCLREAAMQWKGYQLPLNIKEEDKKKKKIKRRKIIVNHGWRRAVHDANSLLFLPKKEKQHPSSSVPCLHTVYGSVHSVILLVNALEHVVRDFTLGKKIQKILTC